MSDEHVSDDERQDPVQPDAQPDSERGEIMRRLRAGVDLGRLRGAGYGTPTPRGATVDPTTGEVTPPEEPKKETSDEPEAKPAEPEKDPVKTELENQLDRIEAYIGRIRRQVSS